MTRALKIAEHTQAPATIDPPSFVSMLARAISDPTLPIERMQQFFSFYQTVEADNARKAFLEAKAAFKATAPKVTQDKKNKQYNSTYASIGNLVNTVNEALSQHGLEVKWDFEQGDRIKVICTLRHVLGHSESVALSGAPDNSGSKNPLQQIKSTITYLKIATFEAVTGIATTAGNLDDDGKASGDGDVITGDQAEELGKLISATNTNIDTFLKLAQSESVSDILAKDFGGLKKLLLAKKGNVQ